MNAAEAASTDSAEYAQRKKTKWPEGENLRCYAINVSNGLRCARASGGGEFCWQHYGMGDRAVSCKGMAEYENLGGSSQCYGKTLGGSRCSRRFAVHQKIVYCGQHEKQYDDDRIKFPDDFPMTVPASSAVKKDSPANVATQASPSTIDEPHQASVAPSTSTSIDPAGPMTPPTTPSRVTHAPASSTKKGDGEITTGGDHLSSVKSTGIATPPQTPASRRNPPSEQVHPKKPIVEPPKSIQTSVQASKPTSPVLPSPPPTPSRTPVIQERSKLTSATSVKKEELIFSLAPGSPLFLPSSPYASLFGIAPKAEKDTRRTSLPGPRQIETFKDVNIEHQSLPQGNTELTSSFTSGKNRNIPFVATRIGPSAPTFSKPRPSNPNAKPVSGSLDTVVPPVNKFDNHPPLRVALKEALARRTAEDLVLEGMNAWAVLAGKLSRIRESTGKAGWSLLGHLSKSSSSKF
ncbi:hypothetical protein SISSUDRAFT_523734 [Sistotremastrum suecicum HHB10207 ss-3]|uniref:Uncharacterized protein n=1 Tax=Sistotremastrum suecicum HHB10207 ss-3 TaxID=1314776 RepID=A0A165XW59_9AGAM|nr:hypothetical protein SISSUDRAFT_523734 [Sistotremastrum suecicum HHB10207 ss-3]